MFSCILACSNLVSFCFRLAISPTHFPARLPAGFSALVRRRLSRTQASVLSRWSQAAAHASFQIRSSRSLPLTRFCAVRVDCMLERLRLRDRTVLCLWREAVEIRGQHRNSIMAVELKHERSSMRVMQAALQRMWSIVRACRQKQSHISRFCQRWCWMRLRRVVSTWVGQAKWKKQRRCLSRHRVSFLQVSVVYFNSWCLCLLRHLSV